MNGFAMRPDEDEIAIPLQLRTGPRRVLERLRAILGAATGSYPEDIRAGLPVVEWASRNGPTPIEAEAYIRDQIRRSGEQVDVLAVDVERGRNLEVVVRLAIPAEEGSDERAFASLGAGAQGAAWYIIERPR